MTEPNLVYAHLIAAMDRHGFNLPAEKPPTSCIISGKHPNSPFYYEQRMACRPVEAAAWAAEQGLVGAGFKISKDIYE